MELIRPLTAETGKKLPFFVLLAFLFAFLLVMAPASAQEPVVPSDVVFAVNTDGFVHVEYTLAVESSFPRVEVPLFGESYENLLVLSGDGSGLDFSLAENVLTIDSLGATAAIISYDTPDLTSKSGSLWTLSVLSPLDATVRMPERATIVSLNTVPLEITDVDGHFVLKMPLGEQEITYVLTFAEARERALAALNQARTSIEAAQTEGRVNGLNEAQARLNQAQSSFNSANYGDAEKLALEASALANSAVAPVVPTAPPEGGSQEAQQPFAGLPLIETIVPAAAVIAVVGLILARRGRNSRKAVLIKEEPVEIDTKKIFDEKPELRFEDREVIEFIAQRGGQAVESEIRDQFKLPKTTVWRMMKRLRNESIAEIYRIGNQNLVKINPRYRKTTAGVP